MFNVGDIVKTNQEFMYGSVLIPKNTIHTVKAVSGDDVCLNYKGADVIISCYYLVLVASSTSTPVTVRFQIGQKVKALIDKPGKAPTVLAGDVVTVVKVFASNLLVPDEFMYEHTISPGHTSTYAGYEKDFSSDLNAPISQNLTPSTLTSGAMHSVFPTGSAIADAWEEPWPYESKPVACDCGGLKAETTHAFWCTINDNKESK